MLIAFLAESPLGHIVRHPILQKDAHLGLFTPEGKITILDTHILMMMIAALLLLVLVPVWLRRRRGADAVGALVPAGPGNAIEAICVYLREEVARPNLAQYTDRFIKFVWTVFFFVLTVNLLGLLPLGWTTKIIGFPLAATATANVWITGTLALITLGMVVINGIRLGGKEFFAHFSPGPLWLAPLLVPLEVIGLVARIFALIVRLCANMIAGHVLLAVLLSFIFAAGAGSALAGVGVAVPVVLGSVGITMLELFVALLHAFIFTFLTTLFIGQAIVFHHDGHGEEAHSH